MTKKFNKLAPGPQLGYVVVFSAADWEQAEHAYGRTLPDRVRRLISIATLLLTLALPIEKYAPKIGGKGDDILEDIERLVDQADLLRAKLYPPHYWKEEYHAYEVPRGLNSRLREQLELISDDSENESSVLRICISGLIESGRKVIRRARDPKNVPREGDAWNAWVVWITLIAQACEFPSGIRSDVYREPSPGKPQAMPSSFVKLIKALQTIACPAYHRSATEGGLAKAIGNARRSIKVPPNIYSGTSVKTDALEREILGVYGVKAYSQLSARELSPLEQALKIAIESATPGIYPFIPEVS